MKHDDTKKGLECCGKGGMCRGHCPYDGRKSSINECTSRLARNALAYIQQLETKCHQLERERDAAVGDLKACTVSHCPYCKNYRLPEKAAVCFACRYGRSRRFEWRGVKED